MSEVDIAAAPQPDPVDTDLRRDAELWRAHQKRKQLTVVKDCDDRYFAYDLSSEKIGPQVCIAEIVTIDAAMLCTKNRRSEMTPKCPDCKRDQDECVCIDLVAENASLKEQVERLNAVIESNIDEGINKIMLMSDEQISALAGFEGRSTEDQETIARQCFEIAERRVDHMKLVEENHELRQQLAASQLEAKRLREALEYKHDAVESLMSWCVKNVNKWDFPQYDNLSYANTKMAETLSSPTSTEALDAYVAEKVKKKVEEHRRATLLRYEQAAEIIRQHDLAVSALEDIASRPRISMNGMSIWRTAMKALAAIKSQNQTTDKSVDKSLADSDGV